MDAFSATLDFDPTLLRPLRHSLTPGSSERAPPRPSDSVMLATHEAAASAMESGESGGTVDVMANRDGDDAFGVHVRGDGVWEAAGSEHRTVRMRPSAQPH